MYIVLENGRPAEYPKSTDGWSNSKFECFNDARSYALSWLGIYGPEFSLDETAWRTGFNYNGTDIVSIVKLERD